MTGRRGIVFLGALSLLLVLASALTAALVQSGAFRSELHHYVAWATVPVTIGYVLVSLRELVRSKA